MISDLGAHSILVLLDLSAVFDTVFHSVLFSRLSVIGITGAALQWLTSFVSDKQQFVKIDKNLALSLFLVVSPRVLYLVHFYFSLTCCHWVRSSDIMVSIFTAMLIIFKSILRFNPTQFAPPLLFSVLKNIKHFLQLNADKT